MSYCVRCYLRKVFSIGKPVVCKTSNYIETSTNTNREKCWSISSLHSTCRSDVLLLTNPVQNENVKRCMKRPVMTKAVDQPIEKTPHIPVMLKEVINIIAPKKGHLIVDMTFGAGGHTHAMLATAPGIKMVISDRDPLAFQSAQSLATQDNGDSTVLPVLSRFSELHHHLQMLGIKEGTVDGFLFDLGVSSMQFDSADRGFSLSRDGPLDMRMDGSRFPDEVTAADVINNLEAKDLAVILKHYGEERQAYPLAQALVEARYAFGNITRTLQLAQIVDSVFEGNYKQDKLQRRAHPATKVFQALRIFVNNELNELHNGLETAHRYLRPQGCCVVLSFHSLEDRIVKRHFHGIEMDAQTNMTVGDHHRNSAFLQPWDAVEEILSKRWQPIAKKVMTPSEEEVAANPRARSAKMRAALKS